MDNPPQVDTKYILLQDKGNFYPRGRLVKLDSDGSYTGYDHSSWNRLSAGSGEVAALTEEECCILNVISIYEERYEVFSTPGKLAWGVGLRVGDAVLAKLPSIGRRGSIGGTRQVLYAAAVIRWCGYVEDVYGQKYFFGVEITVSVLQWALFIPPLQPTFLATQKTGFYC